MINALGHGDFLRWVIARFPEINWEDSVVLEGFRHLESYQFFKKIFPDAMLIYCLCDESVQLSRSIARNDFEGGKAQLIFTHSTEIFADELVEYADMIYTADMSKEALTSRLDKMLVSIPAHF